MWADIRIITRSTAATLQGRPADGSWYDVHRITGVEMTGALARTHGKTKRPIPRLPQTTWSPSYRQRGGRAHHQLIVKDSESYSRAVFRHSGPEPICAIPGADRSFGVELHAASYRPSL